MNLFEQILALLVSTFQGVRRDGLEVLAQALSQTNETIEEATAVVKKMTPEKVAAFITDWRKGADKEITRANQTFEAGLKEKYDFVDKKQLKPQDPPAPPQPGPAGLTAEQIAELVQNAVRTATADLTAQVSSITGAQVASQRKAQLEGIFSGTNVPASFKKSILEGFEGRSFENDEAFNAYLTQQKQTVADFTQELANAGLGGASKPIFGSKNSDGVSSAVTSFIKDQADAAAGKGGGLSGKSI